MAIIGWGSAICEVDGNDRNRIGYERLEVEALEG